MTAPQKVRFSIERASAFVKRQRLCLYSYAETKLDERSDRLGDLRCGDIIRIVAINLHAVMKLPLRYVSETDALAKPRLRNQRHSFKYKRARANAPARFSDTRSILWN